MPHREIDTSYDLLRQLRSGDSLSGLRLQDVDLRDAMPQLLAISDLRGVVVLGGVVPPTLIRHLRTVGAMVFPADPTLPINPYRSTLYDPCELYAGISDGGYAATADKRAYDWSLDPELVHDAYTTMIRAIHDDSIADALDEQLADQRVVGVMGGTMNCAPAAGTPTRHASRDSSLWQARSSRPAAGQVRWRPPVWVPQSPMRQHWRQPCTTSPRCRPTARTSLRGRPQR